MKPITAAVIAASLLAAPAAGQSPGPSITMQAPCAPAEMLVQALKRDGFARIAKAHDVDGDPFAVYRKGNGEWRALSLIQAADGSVWACSILGGDGMSVGDVGQGA
ncbi:MAG: hypothetical protein AB7O45_00560 [Alphaproteobacteria bacterium]